MAIDIKGHGKPLHALTLYCHRDAETDMARWSAPSSFLTAPSCHFILVWRLHCVLLWSVIITPISCHSISFLLDVATDMLLDLEKSVNVAVETNGNIGEDQLDNHRQTSESNNNPAWVSPSSRLSVLTVNLLQMTLSFILRCWPSSVWELDFSRLSLDLQLLERFALNFPCLCQHHTHITCFSLS